MSNTIKRLLEENKFDWVNNDITNKAFPDADYNCDISTCELVDMPGDYEADEVAPFLKSKGLKHCTPDKLLKWALKNPDAQRKNPIVAFGQTCRRSDGCVCVLVLLEAGRGRDAYLSDAQSQFDRRYRILAEPKEVALGALDTRDGARSLGHCPHCDKALEPEFIVKSHEYLEGLFVK